MCVRWPLGFFIDSVYLNQMHTRLRPLPGDSAPSSHRHGWLTSALRVNHAGEYGAKRIYQGQLDVLAKRQDGDSRHAVALITHMAEQEQQHLDFFDDQLTNRQVRPSLFMPLWRAGGYALGAATAMLGVSSAMACTVAVESVIDQHYQEQLAVIDKDAEPELYESITRFREEEVEHHDTGLEEGARQSPLYPLLHAGISALTRTAVEIAKRV